MQADLHAGLTEFSEAIRLLRREKAVGSILGDRILQHGAQRQFAPLAKSERDGGMHHVLPLTYVEVVICRVGRVVAEAVERSNLELGHARNCDDMKRRSLEPLIDITGESESSGGGAVFRHGSHHACVWIAAEGVADPEACEPVKLGESTEPDYHSISFGHNFVRAQNIRALTEFEIGLVNDDRNRCWNGFQKRHELRFANPIAKGVAWVDKIDQTSSLGYGPRECREVMIENAIWIALLDGYLA